MRNFEYFIKGSFPQNNKNIILAGRRLQGQLFLVSEVFFLGGVGYVTLESPTPEVDRSSHNI